MATTSDLYDLIRNQVMGAPPALMDTAVMYAVNKFTRKSYWLRRTVFVDLKAGIKNYPLISPIPGEQVLSAIDGQYKDWPISPSRPELMPMRAYKPLPDATQNNIVTFLNKLPSTIEVHDWPVVDETGTLSLNCAVAVMRNAPAFDDAITLHYGEEIADGALSWLYAQPKRPWSNRQSSMQSAAIFNAAIGRAKGQASVGLQPRDVRVVPRGFAI